ncbi:MAG: tetratricopeptide repeat protein, partial [Acidobacteria bacterium]|nr:tetratricopeptide repeat protein [Acidobacteriota bacterium]
TEKARAEAAIKEFQVVADSYGNPYKEKALYFIAVNRLDIDRDAGIKELTAIAAGTGETAALAKFALAQAQSSVGKYDDAVKLYQELAKLDETVIAKETVNFELGKVYEKQNKKKEAVDIYFNIAKAASELKDGDGKPIPFSQTAAEAKSKLEQLAPERAKEIKEPELVPGG